jgi:DNA invertase Pin-like site-specific DNA recombinase
MKRVAAYARISIENGRTLNSLSAQISRYSNYIQTQPDWEYAGVYADSGKTGTTAERTEFKRLTADCEAGKIDIILTKSISRFARNTEILLSTVRRFKELGVEVRFEKEGINSLSADGELMLSILGSFAQEESRQISENLKWAIRSGFKKGKPHRLGMYGYRNKDGECVIVPEEAETVRRIFAAYLDGFTPAEIAEQLNNEGITNYYGLGFKCSNIAKMLKNERYTGTLLLQKTYVQDYINKKGKTNKGELPMYLMEDAHCAIISKDIFRAVQNERIRRAGDTK